MTYASKIAVGLVLGIAAGLFLGERVAVLQVVADGYIKLLQMTVLPYVMVSLVTGLGALDTAQIKTLARGVGAVLLMLWGIGLVAVFAFPLMFPPQESASFFSTTLVEARQPFDLVSLYIPANPFNSLANSVVPAVVLFSVLVGVALTGVPEKQRLLDVLVTFNAAVARVTAFIVALMPYGLFAITATVAGTVSLAEVQRLQVYLVSYVAVALVVTWWVLPGLVAALTPVPYRAVITRMRTALLTAFMTSSLFVVLPMLIEESKALLREYGREGANVEGLPEIIVPASFNFPHVGKLLTMSFILFAGWFADVTIPSREYPQLAATGLLVLFGNINAAVPFLLDMWSIPADAFHLFEATSVINARFGTLVAAMHTAAIALIGTWAVAAGLRPNGMRLVRYLLLTAVIGAATVVSVRVVVGSMLTQGYDKDEVIAGMQMLLLADQPAVEHRSGADVPAPLTPGPALERIHARGTLRVGHFPDSLPFAYVGRSGRLVGFDIEMAYRLADELGVRLELVPVERNTLIEPLADGRCDVVMSGLAVTPARAVQVRLSNPYLDETMAFVVRDAARERFASWQSIRSMGRVRIGVPRVPYYIAKVRAELPEADLFVADRVEDLLGVQAASLDAIVLTAERGSTWTLLHPEYSVVVPQPRVLKVPLAYAMAAPEQELASFVNTWIDLKRKDGTLDRLFAHWILGQDATARQPRWSVIRDVLHWVR